MTQVSHIFGMENPNDLHLDNLSAADESEDENRDDEIKKLLEEGLSNETFDYESDNDNSLHNATNHNNCSFVSNKEKSHLSLNRSKTETDGGFFRTPNGISVNGNGIGAVDLNMLPNAMQGDGINQGFGTVLAKRSPVLLHDQNTTVNGHPKNGIYSNGGGRDQPIKTILSSNNNGDIDQTQKNKEHEEMEVINPTISLMHKDHCPQNEKEGLGSGIWLTSENSMEQLKTLCEFRERQIQRHEETIATLQKDKRAINHQLGLMKTEMIQIKSHEVDAEKFAQLKEEEVNYLKTKIREAIEEYEQARRGELAATEDNARLFTEIEKLQQQVKLLSSLGQSTQQGEIDDVVRQLRDKHNKDIASWQKVVAELEGQVRTYKRTQQLLHEESFAVIKESVETQTDFNLEEEIERRERDLAAQEFQEEFGGCGDEFIEELQSLSERDIVKRVRKEWRTERGKLMDHYRTEIKIYQQKLAALPSELYQMWQKTQEELGLNRPVVIKPVCRNSTTMTDMKYTAESKPHRDQATSFELGAAGDTNDAAAISTPVKTFKEESVQVNYAAVMANSDKKGTGDTETEAKKIASLSASDEKETSSVVCQTDETLETYRILATLIDSWVDEVNSSKQKAEQADNRSQSADDELKKLKKQFKQMQKMTIACRKEWKKQEDTLKKKNFDMKAHYVEMLNNLNAKLAVIDQ